MTSLSESVRAGNRRAVLEKTADILAKKLEGAPAAVVAQIASQLSKTMAEIDSLPSVEVTEVDELAARRKSRRAEADARVRAKRRRRTEQRT